MLLLLLLLQGQVLLHLLQELLLDLMRVLLLGRNSTTAAALLHMLHLRCRQMLLLQLVLPDRLVVMPPLMLLLQR